MLAAAPQNYEAGAPLLELLSVVAFVDVVVEALVDGLSLLSDFVRFFCFSDLKSVSYQPEPLSRNLGAETFLRNSGLLQAGQSISGASLIFCKASKL